MSTVTVLDVQWLEFGLYVNVFRRLKIYTFHEWIKIDADSPNKAKLFVVFNFIWHWFTFLGIFPYKRRTVFGSYVGWL